MRFKCPKCKKTIKRNVRYRAVKASLTKAGHLRSTCLDSRVICRKVQPRGGS